MSYGAGYRNMSRLCTYIPTSQVEGEYQALLRLKLHHQDVKNPFSATLSASTSCEGLRASQAPLKMPLLLLSICDTAFSLFPSRPEYFKVFQYQQNIYIYHFTLAMKQATFLVAFVTFLSATALPPDLRRRADPNDPCLNENPT